MKSIKIDEFKNFKFLGNLLGFFLLVVHLLNQCKTHVSLAYIIISTINY